MNIQDLLTKILDADINRETKEKIISHWMLPTEASEKAPLQIHKIDTGRVGAVRRPSKEDLKLKRNPKLKEEKEVMEQTIEEVLNETK